MGAIITKLFPSWNDYQKKLLHTSEILTLNGVLKHLRIEEDARNLQKKDVNGESKVKVEDESKVNFVNERKSSNFKRKKRENTNSKDNKKKNRNCYNQFSQVLEIILVIPIFSNMFLCCELREKGKKKRKSRGRVRGKLEWLFFFL